MVTYNANFIYPITSKANSVSVTLKQRERIFVTFIEFADIEKRHFELVAKKFCNLVNIAFRKIHQWEMRIAPDTTLGEDDGVNELLSFQWR